MRISLILGMVGCAPATATLGTIDDPIPDAPAPTDSTTDIPPEETPTDSPPDPTSEPPPASIDPTTRGPFDVTTTRDVFDASCELPYAAVRPVGVDPFAVAVLAHGFLLDSSSMTGWAEHWASWGVAVAVPDLCHSSIFDSDAALNGSDMAELGEHLAGGLPIVYAGHSAGGLAALLAPANSPHAVAVLGFDPVDDILGSGLAAAPDVDIPVAGIYAEDETCNAFGNGLDAFGAAPSHRLLRAVGTDHCDYTNPYESLCDIACANGTADPEVTVDVLEGLSLAWIAWHTGERPDLAVYWQPESAELGAWIDAGLVAIP